MSSYVGRFAPSPTGALHFGSLIAALASYLDAKHHDGLWLLRIEDLDPPRELTSAPKQIMSQLRACGLHWDQEVLFQHSRLDAYQGYLDKLSAVTYPCICPRNPGVYAGTCRMRTFSQTKTPYAIRLKTHNDPIEIDDLFLEKQTFDNDLGDFIIKRKDDLFAYQLAVVIDDVYQKINHVIRGADLLESTPRQIVIAQQLDLPVPVYGHIRLAVNPSGQKLSKQSHALEIDTSSPTDLLRHALIALGQDTHNRASTVTQLLTSAVRSWDRTLLSRAPFIFTGN
jgi:glutamyl-Q tRNA(Asp) synthetase